MQQIGAILLAARQKTGLSLRETEEQSLRLAHEWNRPAFRISASWLNRVEREGRGLSVPKFLVLAVIYNLPMEQLLALCAREPALQETPGPATVPNATLLLTPGPLEAEARSWLPESLVLDPVPEQTTLLAPDTRLPTHYRRGVIGNRDRTLEPMVRSGSILLINTQRRSIAHRREWTTEFDRPIYFLLSRAGYHAGWCELDRTREWLTLVAHPLSYAAGMRWRLRQEVEVMGRVAAVMQRLEA